MSASPFFLECDDQRRLRSQYPKRTGSPVRAALVGDGCDRVSIHAPVELVRIITRSLPLPVLTSSLNSICYGANRLWARRRN